jgi:hypothetical protein
MIRHGTCAFWPYPERDGRLYGSDRQRAIAD